MKSKNLIPIILLSLWGIFCIIGILGNMDHYRAIEWAVIIPIILLPYIIFCIIKYRSKKKLNKITPTGNGDDILKEEKELLISDIKVTTDTNIRNLENNSRDDSENGYAAHMNSYKNLNFKNISLKTENPLPLDEIEKIFLKKLSNQQIDKLSFPVYYTYEYQINYKELIIKLIENGYIKISSANDDISFLTIEQLKSALKILHLPTSGKKQELIIRISNQAGTENALKELGLYNERFILTEIGKEAVKSIIPKATKKNSTHKDLYAIADEQIKQLKDLGTKKYQILCTLDFQTCDKCGKMDSKIFDIKDYKPGVNAPPFHNDCRCTITPYLEDEDIWGVGERAARDKDGNTYYVPGNMTYSKWRKTTQ